MTCIVMQLRQVLTGENVVLIVRTGAFVVTLMLLPELHRGHELVIRGHLMKLLRTLHIL